MRVKVTEAHIEAGHRRDCYACPLALAVREALIEAGRVTGTLHVTVMHDVTVEDAGNLNHTTDFPKSVAERLEAYDLGDSLEPLTFNLWIGD